MYTYVACRVQDALVVSNENEPMGKWPNMAQHGPSFASVAKPSGCTPLCVGCSNVEPVVEATWYTKSRKIPSKSTKSNK